MNAETKFVILMVIYVGLIHLIGITEVQTTVMLMDVLRIAMLDAINAMVNSVKTIFKVMDVLHAERKVIIYVINVMKIIIKLYLVRHIAQHVVQK
jgi:hypothetical protein